VLIDRSRPIQERAFAFRLLAVTLDNHRWLSRQDQELLTLVDEGFAQRAMLLLANARGDVDLRRAQRYAGVVPVPRVVVHVRIDPKESVRRTAARPRGLPARFERLTGEELLSRLAGAAAILDVVTDELGRRGARVFELDGTAPLDGALPSELLDAVAAPVTQAVTARSTQPSSRSSG